VVGPRSAKSQERITFARLDNGLRVALLPDARTNLVGVEVRYDVGGADDPPDAAGLASGAKIERIAGAAHGKAP
jgi:zinc protease